MSDPNLTPAPRPVQPMSSATADIKKVKGASQATIDELRSFLGEMKGRSPAEMLGAVAQSKLIRSLVLATLLTFGFLIAATIIPYILRGDDKPPAANSVTLVPVPDRPERPDPATASTPSTEAPAEETPAPADPPPVDDILDTLGIGETKEAPKGVNPLEGGVDDLLDDLDL